MKLNENDREVLGALYSHWKYRNSGQSSHTPEWSVPMDLGAWDGSFHSNTLKKLWLNGLCDRAPRGNPEKVLSVEKYKERMNNGQPRRKGNRGSPKMYRISEAGIKYWEELGKA